MAAWDSYQTTDLQSKAIQILSKSYFAATKATYITYDMTDGAAQLI